MAFGLGSDGDVQADAPLSYTDNGDGTITDNSTGLMRETEQIALPATVTDAFQT